jgi:hypothetical protein
MIPDFIFIPGAVWPLLPPGIHDSTLTDVFDRYAINPTRTRFFDKMKLALQNLFSSGSPQIFLDGSYVTGKPIPGDYEICWDVTNVDPRLLDPVFLEFGNKRQSQLQKYQGEFFPASFIEGNSGKPFLDFFQTDKQTGQRKGIVRLLNYL